MRKKNTRFFKKKFDIKLTLNIVLNLILIPIYLFLFIFCLLLCFIPIFPTKIALENLTEHLDKDKMSARFFISVLYLNYVFYFFEMFIFLPLHLAVSINKNEFKNFIESLIKKYNFSPDSQNRIVYLSGHLGNLEANALPVSFLLSSQQKNKFIVSLAKPTKYRWLNVFIKRLRETNHLKILWTEGNFILEMVKNLKSGNSLGIFIDQKPPKGGIFIKFFKSYSAFPSAGLRLCLNQEALIVYILSRRIVPGLFFHYYEEGLNEHLVSVYESKTALKSQTNLYENKIYDYQQIVEKEKRPALEIASFTDWLEKIILKCPTQWCWDYKKWSRKIK
ncbi:MAG: hypothetical protein K2X39_02300 [Silvanigrellaceae bacterium]|nr:hypothetical protein [Silvanigrellaceae bacterium]